MRSKVSIYVKCPYYHREEKQKIFCEGVQKGTSIHLAFDSNAKLKGYKDCYCKKDYNKCLLAQMLNRKWEYEAQ